MPSLRTPNAPQRLLIEALAASARNDHRRAARLLKEACSINQADATLWYNLGTEYLALDAVPEALDALSKAEALGDTSCELYSNLGLAWYKAGDSAKAAYWYDLALFANPCYPEALNNMGVLCFLREQYEVARTFFEQAVVYNPVYADALVNLRDTYEALGLDDLKAAIESKLRDND